MAEHINLLFIGDVVGQPGIDILCEKMGVLKKRYSPNFIIINGENSANGKGITKTEADVFYELGANVITTGNHVWDNWKSRPLLAQDKMILRPYNYPRGNPGYGFTFFQIDSETEIAVLQLQGRTFMQTIDCPFRAAENALKVISDRTGSIIVDFHADATAEKISMGWALDGRVSALIGTHTHIQTSDASILPKGTAYITDVGMTGPYDSVVGLKKEIALKRFTLQTPHKYELAEGDAKVSGAFVSIDAASGQALKIEPFVEPDFIRSVFEQL